MAGAREVTLRRATMTDVQAMAAIEVAAFSDPWPASSFVEMLPLRHARMAVAVDARQTLVGYCILLSAADQGEIANIAVKPSARRRGVGALLLEDALEAATGLGVTQLFLEVRTSNVVARSLYASRGFVAVGRRIAYYRDPLEDALVLRRDAAN